MSLASAAELLTPLLYFYFLTFCRIGAAFSMFPAFTDHIPQKARILLALAVSLPISILVGDNIVIEENSQFVLAIFTNIVVGLYLGVMPRIFLSSLQITGQIMGQTSGMYNPFNMSGLAFESSTIISTILMLSGIALIFASDMHLYFIEALVGSFYTIGLQGNIDATLMSEGSIAMVSRAFSTAIEFAAPFLILSIAFNLALGVANKMMPTMPVYFVFSPLLIFLGLTLLLTIYASLASSFTFNLFDVIGGIY